MRQHLVDAVEPDTCLLILTEDVCRSELT